MANSESKVDCPQTCDETFYGCCLDNVSTARGTGYAGCPIIEPKKNTYEDDSSKNVSQSSENNLEYVEDDDDVEENITIVGINNNNKESTLLVRDEKQDAEMRNNLTNNGILTCAQTKYECCPDGLLAALVIYFNILVFKLKYYIFLNIIKGTKI